MLLLDDTTLIRGDTPDLFSAVPPSAIGAVVESRTREFQENVALVANMCSFYGVAPNPAFDDVVINSGVLLTSSKHHYNLLFGPGTPYKSHETPINGHIYGDQAYVNAMLHTSLYDFPSQLLNLGFGYNYIGSFENINRRKVSFASKDAYVVHATTGVLLSKISTEGGYDRYILADGMETVNVRANYLKELDKAWRDNNL